MPLSGCLIICPSGAGWSERRIKSTMTGKEVCNYYRHYRSDGAAAISVLAAINHTDEASIKKVLILYRVISKKESEENPMRKVTPETQEEIIRLRKEDGLTYEKIAERMDLSVVTVGKTIRSINTDEASVTGSETKKEPATVETEQTQKEISDTKSMPQKAEIVKNFIEKRITSADIKIALKEMHLKRFTYFITECKTCSTYFPDPQGLLIFDGLSITKSYTKPCIVGYEIKVSRSDFLQDNKWHLYLQYCNEFFFVVPKGLVKKDELPDGVGLIYYSPNTKETLHTVKKALYRQIEEPVGVYKYIIYSRLEEDRLPFYEDRADYVRDYLEDKAYKKSIGDRLGSKMAKELQSALERLDKLSGIEEELSYWNKVKKVLEKHNLYHCWWRQDDYSWVDELDKALSVSVKCADMDTLERQLQFAMNTVKRLKEETKQ